MAAEHFGAAKEVFLKIGLPLTLGLTLLAGGCGDRPSSGPLDLEERRAATSEATQNLKRITDGAVKYMEARVAAGEKVGALRFPDSVGLTPGAPTKLMCRKGVRHTHAVDAGTWDHPGWRALGFTAAEAHLNYAYSFISRGSGANAHFTARAVGDLTCDGVMATFERLGRLDRAGKVTVSAGVYGLNEFE